MEENSKGKAEKLFNDFGKKLDGWIEEIKETASEAEDKYADRIEELKQSGDKLKEEFDDFKERHKDGIDEVEAKFKKAGEELRGAFKRVFKD